MSGEPPISNLEICNFINKLIERNGLDLLTSSFIRKQLKEKYKFNFDPFKKLIDSLISGVIQKRQEKEIDDDSHTYDSTDDEIDFSDIAEKYAIKNEEKQNSPSSKSIESSDSSDDDGPEDRDYIKKKSKSLKSRSSLTNSIDSDNDVFDGNDMASAIKRRRAAANNKRSVVNSKSKNSSSTTKRPAASSGFTKIMMVSDELFAITTKKYMRRSDVVKYMWDYFKSKGLIDPNNKKMVLCDDKLKALTGVNTFQAFGMMKYIKNHLKDADNLDEETRSIILKDLGVEDVKIEKDDKNVSKRKSKSVTSDKSGASKVPKKGKSSFSRFCVLSDELSNLTGQRYMTRSDVVKFMWDYFKGNNLMDPKDKRMVIINDQLRPIFPQKRIQAFVMMKSLKNHIKDPNLLGPEHMEAITALHNELEEKRKKDEKLNFNDNIESKQNYTQEENKKEKEDTPIEEKKRPNVFSVGSGYQSVDSDDEEDDDDPYGSSSIPFKVSKIEENKNVW
ncbi:SWIB/MDM2 domain and Homeodomain-like and SWIB domain-containing protein [Strongyloides ratti]|uniref:SWIB/MDM2 domain and Homeodomain-like and SWIB domain-containing protein n=1 Tax=Strongyloides ratti TaxID=34506 RepID=A0A090MYH1_STRRB|nr:SWIB/MDM2 domain and Homeodomain-like and SWIB domain-containing protein [Strongyloides ratti]CEF67174.1 SWIB/MDM2 domain and Homeodomain-like and SWIB domain-containing protein [Strongyloides ratti]